MISSFLKCKPGVYLLKYYKIRWVASLGLLLLLDLATFLALAPAGGQAHFHHQDKVMHALAFAGLTVWGFVALQFDFFPGFRKHAFKIVFLNTCCWLLYGALLEVAQSFTTHRQGDWGDLLADGVGILIGSLLVLILKLHPIGDSPS